MNAHGGHGQVLHHVHILEQVELLEHHAHLLPVDVDIRLFIADIHAVKNDLPIGRRFQQVQAPQKGALAAAGGADDADHFLCVERGADIIENRQLAEALGQVADFDHFIFCHEPSSFPSGRSAARQ